MWLFDLFSDVFLFWLVAKDGSSNPDQGGWAWVRLVIALILLIGVVVTLYMIFSK